MITYAPVSLGCDPELFLSQDGKIIGSERVIPSDGVSHVYQHAKVVRDGIQVELQPTPSTCRESLLVYLSSSFKELSKLMIKGVKADFSPVIQVAQEELDSLSEASRTLGCAPSNNSHDPKATITVNAATFRTRSAGGHIHLGLNVHQPHLMERREELIPLMDILLGNTCVMLDKGEQARERRKVYGRAGEYRLPVHGIEYRTLSNFWLRSPQLASFVLGMARIPVSMLVTDRLSAAGGGVWDDVSQIEVGQDGYKRIKQVTIPANQQLQRQLLSLVDIKQVVRAINNNDEDLARRNFEMITPWIKEHIHPTYDDHAFPLHQDNLTHFEYFLTKPIEEWFPMDPFANWTTQVNSMGRGVGWEKWLRDVVGKRMFLANNKEAV